MTGDTAATISKAREHSIGDLLRRAAGRDPGKLGVSCGNVSWTFAEMDAICNRLGRGLVGLGVKKGDRLAVLSRNSHAFAALRFAVARIGAVLVPINFMLNPDEINFILKSSGAKLLAAGPDFVEPARAASARDCAVEKMIWLPGEDPATAPASLTTFDDLLSSDGSYLDASVDSRDLAQIVYTSGTESLPKGAMLTHDAVMWQYVSCIIDGGMSVDDKFLHALPLYHCAQLDVFLGPQIYLGASGVITGKPAADNILTLIQAHRITSFFAPPTIWIAMLRSPNFDKTDLSTLQKGYYGASIMPVEVLLELQRRLPSVKFWKFLRPDRDRAARDRAGSCGPTAQGRLGGQARAQCRDPRGQHFDGGCEGRRSRRDRAPLAASALRLLQRSGQDGGGVLRRLVSLRRSRHRR
ncbi:acyl-CoA synthetase (AMP-forming)/AMP-acid ligase II [Bradyrhizobium sp. GM5.1]